MSDSPAVVELRRSVSLLATEWWVPVGLLAGYLIFGGWVVATGIALANAVPALATTPVAAVGSTAITGRDVFALVVWVAAPALAATRLLDTRLSNSYGNLASQYRLDNPGALPAAPGVVLVLATLVALVVGPAAPVVAVLALASTHFLVRTVAYGRRVYSVSSRPLFGAMVATSGAALAAAWLVHGAGLPAPASAWVGQAGVGSVVETGLGVAGTTPGTALGVLVTIPALLAGGYLAVQTAVARRVRARAPLSAPEKRAEQRFPIMPPVSQQARAGAAETNGAGATSGTETPVSSPTGTETTETPVDDGATDAGEDGATDTGAGGATDEDDSSHTRVFTTDEAIPEDDELATAVAEESGAGDDGDDEWIDDTSIFSPDDGTPDGDECGVCGDPLPEDKTVTFCPNCGQQIRD